MVDLALLTFVMTTRSCWKPDTAQYAQLTKDLMTLREVASIVLLAKKGNTLMKKVIALNVRYRPRLVKIRPTVFLLIVKRTKSSNQPNTNVRTAMTTSIQMTKVETAFNAT